MKDRHWKRISNVTSYAFDVDSPTFTLRNVMEAPLLAFKDDVEDICISAVKEKDIEAKLKQVIADWAIVELSFSTFKTRGELLLKGQDTGEIITALEDSLMVMNSLLSNRYDCINASFYVNISIVIISASGTTHLSRRTSNCGCTSWWTLRKFWRSGSSCRTSGYTWRPYSSEATSLGNCQPKPKDLAYVFFKF